MVITFILLAAQASAPSTATAMNSAEEKIICKTSAQTQSRIPERICRKRSEWAFIEKQNADDLNRSVHDNASGRNATIIDVGPGADGRITAYKPPR